MTLLLPLLTHVASVALGAALLWAWRKRGARRTQIEPAQLETDEPQAQALKTLVDQLSLATQTAGIGIWHMDVATRRFTTDAHVRALLGTDREVDDPFKLLHPQDRLTALAATRAAMKDPARTLTSIRHRVLRTDGSERHIETHVRIFRSADGRAERLLGVTRDVSEQVAHASQLKQQAAHVETLLNRLSVATQAAGLSCWEMDLASGQHVWVGNRIHVFGLDEVPMERYSAALDRLIHPEDRNILRTEADEAIAQGRATFSTRFRLMREDGTTRYMQTYAHVLRDAQGEPARLVGATADITNEIQTTDLLQRKASEERALIERLSIAADAAGIVSWEIDLEERRFLWVENPVHGNAAQLLAEEGSDLEHHLARIHPDDRRIVEEAIRGALAEHRERISYRYRILDESGKAFHVQCHARILTDGLRGTNRLLGVSRDVTREVEDAEQLGLQAQKLRDAERRLERASLSSSEGHWESDLTSGRVWYSSSYHALLGYHHGELPENASGFERIVHPEDLNATLAAMRSHILGGTPFLRDVRLRTRDGEYRWFRQRGMAERDRSGRALSIAGSIQDIHEQKLAEDALRLVRQRFERAVNGTQDGLWESEANGAAWCSRRAAELLGYAPEELREHTDFMKTLLHPDDRAAVDAATHSHFEHGTPYDVEVRLRTRSGEYRWYRARASAERDAGGRPLRLSGSLQDVTDARAAREELLRATEAAEAANRAKSEFLANVSHEIRTPMNGIIGMTGLLLDTRLDRTQRDYSETIRSSADSLLVVINDILDFSKIEAGKLDIESIELDLRSNVEDVATMLAFQAAAKNLELVVHVHPDVPGHVIGDPQRMRQCLINLVGNAIKFTSSGEIVIEVSTLERREGRIATRFEVRDTGIGIAEDKLATLFQPFVQVDSSTTRHFGGTGLGLSIVRRLVEMMGGEVGARSVPGKGSCFWFVLPLEPVAQAEAPPLDLARLGRRILVVDDNETNRRVIAGQLMHSGYEVSLAGGGIEAISLMRQAHADEHPFEVVLIDYRMHDMDGAALGERINADAQLSRARIVMLTSMDRQGDTHRFASLGFAAYLTKPVRGRELTACLDRVLARDAREWHLKSQPIVTRGALVSESAPRYRCSVLLVEDNAVNQKVAVRFLERMGCKVRVADNGAEGVRAYAEASYDIVLMDLQMPVMDGLSATKHIRNLETEGRHTPIVALTANAMTGQLERCLEAGMNGFLTKPLEIARLHELFERYGFSLDAPDTERSEASRTPAAPVELARLNEITDGDPEFAAELISTFVASGAQVLEEIRAAREAFDRPALSRAAHKLKGAAANIHAEGLRELAFALETQAPGIDQPRLRELIEELAAEFGRAADYLRQQMQAPVQKTG